MESYIRTTVNRLLSGMMSLSLCLALAASSVHWPSSRAHVSTSSGVTGSRYMASVRYLSWTSLYSSSTSRDILLMSEISLRTNLRSSKCSPHGLSRFAELVYIWEKKRDTYNIILSVSFVIHAVKCRANFNRRYVVSTIKYIYKDELAPRDSIGWLDQV